MSQRYAVPAVPINPADVDQARFWRLVEKTETCWNWKSYTHNGYGEFDVKKKTRRAHRISYTLLRGEIPAGMTLDHLCRNRACVNPDHLEPVPLKENTARGAGYSATVHRTGVCGKGHSMEDAYPHPTTGKLWCRTCMNQTRHNRYVKTHPSARPYAKRNRKSS